MVDEVLAEKALTIERCAIRAREQYAASSDFAADYDRQDIVVLNLQRACEAAIDMAFRLIRMRRIGAPMANADAFAELVSAGLLTPELGRAMQKMVGFRNIAVHQYTKMNLHVVEAVINRDLDDLLRFSAVALRLS